MRKVEMKMTQEKRKIKIEVCLNSNQPPHLDVTQYNVYVYNEVGEEMGELWEGDLVAFQVEQYMEALKKLYTIGNVIWLDLEGNEMEV